MHAQNQALPDALNACIAACEHCATACLQELEQVEMTNAALIIHLRSNKTNQAGETEDRVLFFAANPRYCPVRAFLDWQRVLGRTSGPVFVSLVHGQKVGESKISQKRLSDVRVNRLVKQHLGEQYSAHSFWASFITTAKLNGQSNEFIKNRRRRKRTPSLAATPGSRT